MYKLYYSPGACSMAVHVVLNEIGASFEPVKVELSKGEGKTPEYLKLNPRGQVPVLQEGDEIIKEGAAIITYLLDKHNSPMMPKSGIARAKALEWLCWANATLHAAYSKAFWVGKAVTDEKAKAALMKDIGGQIQSIWDEADARLGKSKYLAGDSVSAADVLMAVIANWNQWLPGMDIKFGANVQRVIKDVIARPAYQKALKAEQVEYKVAA